MFSPDLGFSLEASGDIAGLSIPPLSNVSAKTMTNPIMQAVSELRRKEIAVAESLSVFSEPLVTFSDVEDKVEALKQEQPYRDDS